MKQHAWLQHAEALAEGEPCFLRLSPQGSRIPVFALVNFVGYTACPAVVVVKDGLNARFSCERRALYRLNP